MIPPGESETLELNRSTSELRRVGSTTTVMSQDEYARLLLDRNHSRHRWENQPAVGVCLEDLDREESLRTGAADIQQRRLSAGTNMDVGSILRRAAHSASQSPRTPRIGVTL